MTSRRRAAPTPSASRTEGTQSRDRPRALGEGDSADEQPRTLRERSDSPATEERPPDSPKELTSPRAVLIASWSLIVCALPLMLIGPLGVRLREDLGFDEAALGVGAAILPAASAVSSRSLGHLVERHGALLGLRLAASIAAAAALGTAIFARSLVSYLPFLVLGGLALGVNNPAGNLWLVRTIPPQRHGLAFAVKHVAAPASALLAGLAVPAVAVTVGWRWAYVIAGGLALALLGIVSRVPRRTTALKPRDAPTSRAGDLPSRPLVVLACAMGLGTASVGALSTFLVSSAVDAGMAESIAGLLFALGSLVGIAVRLHLGHVADRSDRDQLTVVALLLAVGAGAYLLLATANTVVIWIVAPLAFATGWGWPGLFTVTLMRMNTNAPAAASGVLFTGAATGTTVGPLLFGFLARSSYATGWIVAAGAAAAAALTTLVGRRVAARSEASAVEA